MKTLSIENFLFCFSLRTGTSMILFFTLLFYFFAFWITLAIPFSENFQLDEVKVLWIADSALFFFAMGFIPILAVKYFPMPDERYLPTEPQVRYIKYLACYYCVLTAFVVGCLGVAVILSFTRFKEVQKIIIIIDLILPGILLHFTAVVYSFYRSLLWKEDILPVNNGSKE